VSSRSFLGNLTGEQGKGAGMKVVLAGSSGLLGSHLRQRLVGDGHEIVQLVRRPPTDRSEQPWQPDTGDLDPAVLAGADAVVNLAGAGIEDKRWNEAFKQLLITSRVRPTGTLARAIAGLSESDRPKVMVSASAIGFYGETGDALVEEDTPAGTGFFPGLCQAWEAATGPAEQAGVRVVHLRTGLVLDPSGGLLKAMSLVFRLFAGGPLAGGRQWMPWISMPDWTSAVVFLIGREDVAGPVNVVGPDPVRNADFTKALARAVHRPAPWPIPRFALRTVLGEFANETLASQRVLPGVLNRAGFEFQHTTVDEALRSAFA
jgi:uncharacterized protein (TIGR01777 family)